MKQSEYTQDAIHLLRNLIEVPSFSSEEDKTADILVKWMEGRGITSQRVVNNVWATNKYYDAKKPNLLLNSHHDTVKPNAGYTLDPFHAILKDDCLYGLGSNDAGGCLVSLLQVFRHFYNREDLKYNLIMVASAEEESSGANGLGSVLPHIPEIDVAIVGEPTQMHLAIAEKGLVVFDVVLKGKASHAAHPNPDNVLYKSIPVLQWFRDFKFDKISDQLGAVKMTVTQISAGTQHNAVPAELHMVVDVRVNDCYTNAEIVEMLRSEAPVDSITPRSIRLNSSSIPSDHPLVKAGIQLNRNTYGSPTLSDQSALSCPSMKLGPGDSTRSHTADEFIRIHEIEEGIDLYIKILDQVL